MTKLLDLDEWIRRTNERYDRQDALEKERQDKLLQKEREKDKNRRKAERKKETSLRRKQKKKEEEAEKRKKQRERQKIKKEKEKLAEKLQRKKEKEFARKLREKEKKKEREAKLKEKKEQRRERNRLLYKQRKSKKVDKMRKRRRHQYRKSIGDKRGFFRIMIVKNKEKYMSVSKHLWMVEAYRAFNDAATGFKENVIGVKRYKEHHDRFTKERIKEGPYDYELLLLKRIDKNNEENVSYIRDENGKAIKHIVADNENYIILEKSEWGISDHYFVHGYSPKDKKTGKWIVDNLILTEMGKKDSKKVFMHQCKIIIQHGVDFDIVVCRNVEECEYLYGCLEKYVMWKKAKNIFFTGHLLPFMTARWMDRIQKKTGWTRRRVEN